MSALTLELWFDAPDEHTARERRQQLRSWRAQHTHAIVNSFTTAARDLTYGRRRVAIVIGDPALVNKLPGYVTWQQIAPLEPLLTLTADTWNGSYDMQGTTVHGTKHFEPGTPAHFHGRYSGDGFERAYATGAHRDDGNYCTVMCVTNRFVNWRADIVHHPVVVYHLANPRGYRGAEPEQWIAEMVCAMNARVARAAN